MKDYLTHLYEMDLHENETKPVTSASAKEDELYTKLEQTHPSEQFLTDIDFTEEYGNRMAQECEIYFKKGFRYAVRLILECFNENDKGETL